MTPITLPDSESRLLPASSRKEADLSPLRGSFSCLPPDPGGTEPHHRSPQVLSHSWVTCGEHTLFTHLDWGGRGLAQGLAGTHTRASYLGLLVAASLEQGSIVAKKEAGAGPQVLRPGFATYSLVR